MNKANDVYIIRPDPNDARLTERVSGIDQTGQRVETSVTVERALTIFLNAQEIVTAMTINDYPEYLAIGYLLNQHMLLPDDEITGVDYDEELATVVVRTKRKTNYEKKLKKKVQTSGCAQGTVFGDLMDALENVSLPQAELRTSWLYALTHKINTTPSLYLEAGAIHGCVLARKANLTLVGRARGKRFVALAGEDRIVFDQDLSFVEEESAKHRRKAAVHDE
jgi:FdhD protein